MGKMKFLLESIILGRINFLKCIHSFLGQSWRAKQPCILPIWRSVLLFFSYKLLQNRHCLPGFTPELGQRFD